MPELPEADYYAPFKSYLLQKFQVLIEPSTGTDFFHAEVVAEGGGPNSGRWSTPDLVAVSVWRPAVLPTPVVTLRSFELKRASQCDISSVHQALAHSRFADFVYLAAPVDDSRCSPTKRREIEKQCLVNGVGLFWIRDKDDPNAYEQPVRPVRKNPNPLAVDEFLHDRLPEDSKLLVRNWCYPQERGFR